MTTIDKFVAGIINYKTENAQHTVVVYSFNSDSLLDTPRIKVFKTAKRLQKMHEAVNDPILNISIEVSDEDLG